MKLFYIYKDKDGKLHKLEDENCVLSSMDDVIQELKESFQTNVLAVLEN